MVTDSSNSILADQETTFEEGSTAVKHQVDELVNDQTQEAKDKMLGLAKDHGVAVTPDMTPEEIQDSIHDVL